MAFSVMKNTIVTVLCFLFCNAAISQINKENFNYIDSLQYLRNKALNAIANNDKITNNYLFYNLLENFLEQENSFKESLNAISNFSIVESDNNMLKLYTWYIEKDNHLFENFGFIQYYSTKEKEYKIFSLKDKKTEISNPQLRFCDNEQWYGAVYYQIITFQKNNKTYYTLLGWNGNNLFSNQKIIDILSFDEEENPIFGDNIFENYPIKNVTRIIFEYSKNSSYSLRYDIQSYPVEEKNKKNVQKIITGKIIIFDKLIPLDESMNYNSTFAVAENSMQQGFVEDKGKWKFLPEVYGRGKNMPASKYEPKKKNYYNPN